MTQYILLNNRVDSRLEQGRFGWTKADFTWAQDKFHGSISYFSGKSTFSGRSDERALSSIIEFDDCRCDNRYLWVSLLVTELAGLVLFADYYPGSSNFASREIGTSG